MNFFERFFQRFLTSYRPKRIRPRNLIVMDVRNEFTFSDTDDGNHNFLDLRGLAEFSIPHCVTIILKILYLVDVLLRAQEKSRFR